MSFHVTTLADDPNLAAKLHLQMASVSIRYYHRAILECVTWGENMGRMAQSRSLISGNSNLFRKPTASTKNKQREEAACAAEDIHKRKGEGVLFVVKIDNPYVIIPRDSFQSVVDETKSNQMEVDLGQIVIDNKMVSLRKAMGTRRASKTKRKNLVDIAVAKSRERKGEVDAPLVSVRSRRVIDGKITKRTDQKSIPPAGYPNTEDIGNFSAAAAAAATSAHSHAHSTNAASTTTTENESQDSENDDNGIVINRMCVSVSAFTVTMRCAHKKYEFVKRTGATFLVDLPVNDHAQVLPDATIDARFGDINIETHEESILLLMKTIDGNLLETPIRSDNADFLAFKSIHHIPSEVIVEEKKVISYFGFF